jgi:hypothetical protein
MPIKTGALDHAIRGRLAHALVERRLMPILKNVRGATNLCDQLLAASAAWSGGAQSWRTGSKVGATPESQGFGKIRQSLLTQQRPQLVNLIGELYRLSRENRRFLEARLGEAGKQLPLYRQLVTDCLFPDPLRKGAKVQIAEAKRMISQYERATGDAAGTADLMLTFVEQGTALAADLGYGDDGFFSALEEMLSRVLQALQRVTEEIRRTMRPRLIDLSELARNLGWEYGDFVVEHIAAGLRWMDKL